MTLGPARDWDAGRAVGFEEVEDVVSLWTLEQFLEPRGIFEALFEGLRTLVGIVGGRLPIEPGALLLGIEELAQTFCAASIGRAFKGAIRHDSFDSSGLGIGALSRNSHRIPNPCARVVPLRHSANEVVRQINRGKQALRGRVGLSNVHLDIISEMRVIELEDTGARSSNRHALVRITCDRVKSV